MRFFSQPTSKAHRLRASSVKRSYVLSFKATLVFGKIHGPNHESTHDHFVSLMTVGPRGRPVCQGGRMEEEAHYICSCLRHLPLMPSLGNRLIASSQSTILCLLSSSEGREPFKASCTDKLISLRALECNRSHQRHGILGGCFARGQQNSCFQATPSLLSAVQLVAG